MTVRHRARACAALRDDRGITLVELVIAGALLSVIALLAGQIMITAFDTQGTVTVSTKAATQGQAITEVIDQSVRTAKAIHVTGDRLDVETAAGQCQAFAVVDGSQTFHRITSDWKIPADSDRTTWPEYAQEVRPLPSGSSTEPFFVEHSNGVKYSFRLGGTEDDPEDGAVDIVSTIVPRAGGSESPCF